MKKWIFVITALMLSLTACGENSSNFQSSPPSQSASATSSEAVGSASGNEEGSSLSGEAARTDSETPSAYEVTYPVTITDQLGRQVTLYKEPETIVSGYYISTSLLIALNRQERLTGVEAKAGSRSLYRLSAPAVAQLPSVGTAKEFDLEGCAALSPDLIILPAKLKDTIPSLEDLGLTVLAVNPEDQELLEETVTLLGTALNCMDQAQALLDHMNNQLTQLRDCLADVEKPAVYLAGNSSFLSTAGPRMYQNSLITNAGGQNVAQELTDTYWSGISYEQLLAWNPEYIILAADASYSVDSVLEDPSLADCAAVQKGQVYQLPGDVEAWDSPVPGSFLGSLWLAGILHPQEYPVSDWESAVTEFYETFYRFTPDTAVFSHAE